MTNTTGGCRIYSGWSLASPEFARKLNKIVVTKMLDEISKDTTVETTLPEDNMDIDDELDFDDDGDFKHFMDNEDDDTEDRGHSL